MNQNSMDPSLTHIHQGPMTSMGMNPPMLAPQQFPTAPYANLAPHMQFASQQPMHQPPMMHDFASQMRSMEHHQLQQHLSQQQYSQYQQYQQQMQFQHAKAQAAGPTVVSADALGASNNPTPEEANTGARTNVQSGGEPYGGETEVNGATTRDGATSVGLASEDNAEDTDSKGPSAVARSVKLAAFNFFGASVREDFQKRKGNTSGRDVEKWIGQRWREMDQIERQKYHDLASKELERRGGAMVSKKKRRKQEAEEREKRKSAKKRSTKESSVSIERDRTASTTTTNPNQLIGLLTEGVVDDVFDGGFFSTLTIAGHRPVRAMVFHPLLAKIDE